MEKYLDSKKILFIAPIFFGYEKDIQTELERQGAEVIFIGDDKKLWSKNLFTIKAIVKREYDYLFVIKGEFVQKSVLELFKESNPKAECILYQYDTLKRYPHIIKLFDFFDRVYSFDIEDCQQYNLILRPLFFVKTEKINTTIKYDISSVASYYPERLQMIQKLKKQCKKDNISSYFYIYVYWRMFINKIIYFFKYLSDISTKTLSKNKMFYILKHSKAIVDIPVKGQDGLTMRTFEVIGQEKKLITTNPSIVKYDFYDTNNIFLLKEDNITDIKQFLARDIKNIDKEILNKYSLSFFCKSIFCDLKITYLNEK
ncbi:hypothetical protein [Capnocytophaga ochracea]|uniref:Lipopolysaccharide biosynthesis protein n=1 Tax=Capnocytophaga ochracea TaxID=1018 RepID=A0A2X2SJ60_CAPOC|nr:hypothetical protein [Capnocytophaga ochracea]SQA93196.1 Uncharacterised protein [Capnocytophaga ochracea]